ncbi:MAG: Zn-ribbon domain-containing OB-fold protein [Endozoicomonas sp.]|uniref:Zn-ribbon domain-containing OB-fold protein n=1 Tax=Endozoicomonas sp. TaxID=1892382 RepID=UPI003D9B04CC
MDKRTASQSLGPEAQFWAYLKEGRFMIQKSGLTGNYVFYPRMVEPETGCSDLDWVEVSGKGTVYTTTMVHRRPEKGGSYNLAIIELEEGPRMMGRIEGCPPESVSIGMSVVARVEEPSFGPYKNSGQPIVVFYSTQE